MGIKILVLRVTWREVGYGGMVYGGWYMDSIWWGRGGGGEGGVGKMKLCGFTAPLCMLIRLIWAKQAQGTMR